MRARAHPCLPIVAVLVSAACSSPPPENVDAGSEDRPDAGETDDSGLSLLAGSAAGPGTVDGPRLSARFGAPAGLGRAADGSVFVVDATNAVVRRIAPDGTVSTFAGTMGQTGAEDGKPGRFSGPNGLAVAADGTLFVADADSATVRRIAADGTISTLAGTAGERDSVDGTGADARFENPEGLALDGDGHLWVVDSVAHVLRKISPAGVVTTVAGTPGEADFADGTGADARFDGPRGVAVLADGTVVVADTGNNVLRLVTPAGVVTTLAGDPDADPWAGGAIDGTGAAARFNGPRGIAVTADGAILVADTGHERIRRATVEGVVTTVAGSGESGTADGPVESAQFLFPVAVVELEGGALLVSEAGANRLRRVAEGRVETFAGSAPEEGSDDGVGPDARFSRPNGLLALDDGTLLVADLGNATLRRIAPDGETTTWLGIAGEAWTADGAADEVRFQGPTSLVSDGAGGFFVVDIDAGLIRRVQADGTTETWAGGPSRGGAHVDGPRLDARFAAPTAIARDAAGNLYVTDARNHALRRIDTEGDVTTLAGDGRPGWEDGVGANARFHYPQAVAVNADGVVFVADTYSHTIRRVEITNGEAMVTTFAGIVPAEDGRVFPGHADGTGSEASFHTPMGLAFAADGSLLVADSGTGLLRRVTMDRKVTTIAGTPGRLGFVPGGLPGSLPEVSGLAVLPGGSVAMSFNHGVLVVRF